MLHTVEPTIGPRGAKKILVVSHERSGTHFLMNTIADNFGYVSDPWCDIDDDRVVNPYYAPNIKAYLQGFEGVPVLNLFKTHFEYAFFEPIIDWLVEEFRVFYIKRSDPDVLKSLRKHIEALPWNAGPKTETWAEFCHAPPSGGLLRYQMREHRSVSMRLRRHWEDWMWNLPGRVKKKIIYVEYEALNERFEQAVEDIGRQLGLMPVHYPPVRPGRFDRVITPEKEKRYAETA